MTRQKRSLSDIHWLVLHHTASNDKYSTHDTIAAHQAATGLGYHGLVDDDAVFKAKAAGADGHADFGMLAPLDEVVWGAAGCNFNGAHLSVDGNSLTTGVTDDEVNAVIQVFAAWAKKLGWKKADVLGPKSKIIPHSYVGTHISATRYVTECPGAPLVAKLPYIRERVASYLPA